MVLFVKAAYHKWLWLWFKTGSFRPSQPILIVNNNPPGEFADSDRFDDFVTGGVND